MKRGTLHETVLRGDRKVFSPVGFPIFDSVSFIFSVHRSGFRSGFFMSARFGRNRKTARLKQNQIFIHNQSNPTGSMQDNATLAQQISAAAPAATRNAADLSNLTFKRLTYADAVEFLKTNGFPELQWGDDLGAEEENRLTELMGPMFVTHYPADIKFFNMRNNDEDPRVVNSSDLLLPLAGESAGSAEREFDADKLRHKLETSSMLEALLRQGMKLADFDWYLDFHKEHAVKLHSGAGVGMARVAQFILGQTDIRACVPFLINRDNVI